MTNIDPADQPNMMVAVEECLHGDEVTSYFRADNPDDARLFRDYHGARPLHPERWPWPDWEDFQTRVVGDTRITYPLATTVTCELVKDDDV